MSQDYLIGNRLAAVRRQMDGWQVESVLIGSNTNRRWLSGFSGSAGWLLVTRDHALLATDFRYWEQATRQASAFELVRLKGRTDEALAQLVRDAAVSPVGIEAEHLTVSGYDALQKIDGVTWRKLRKSVEPLREVKSAEELAAIRAAAAITDLAMARVNELAQVGLKERELAWELEKTMRDAGADSVAFPIIVASGPNAALAHHRPGDRCLQHGDAIIVDMGAALNGYMSDLTRTFHLGDEPDEHFWRVYNVVLQAQTAVLQQARTGMTGKEVDSLARDVIVAAGFGDEFGHSLGHGVGLEVHEGPRFSQLAEEETMPAGAVVTVEPGIYQPGWGGVRIEDLVLLTETGIEQLSHCPKQPIIAGAANYL
jgi:Xaa-Pro aminopeptidase